MTGCQLATYKVELLNWGEVKNHNYFKSIEDINQILKPLKENSTLSSIESISEVFVTRESNNLHTLFIDLENGFFKKNTELELLASSYLTGLSLRLWGENKLDNTQLILRAYEYGLESGILLSFGKIPLVRWYNILSVMSSILEKNKTIQFLNTWIGKVSTINLKKSIFLSKALVDFHTENYQIIYSSLKNIKYSNLSEKFRANQLIAISLYKQQDLLYEEFIDHCNNSLRSLKRSKKKLGKKSFTLFENFIIVLIKLASLQYKRSKYEIKLPHTIPHKNWLVKEIKRVNDKISPTL